MKQIQRKNLLFFSILFPILNFFLTLFEIKDYSIKGIVINFLVNLLFFSLIYYLMPILVLAINKINSLITINRRR